VKREKELRNSIDEACRNFAIEGKWYDLTDEQLGFVGYRLVQAFEFLQNLKIYLTFIPVPERSKKDLVEFMLIGYWNRLGRERWIGENCRPHFERDQL